MTKVCHSRRSHAYAASTQLGGHRCSFIGHHRLIAFAAPFGVHLEVYMALQKCLKMPETTDHVALCNGHAGVPSDLHVQGFPNPKP